jgi:hypothetical protein
MVIGPLNPGFLTVGLPARVQKQESPIHKTGAEACCLGLSHNHKSRAVVVILVTVFCESLKILCHK